MTSEGNRKMARTPGELAANNLRVSKSRVRTLERRLEVASKAKEDAETKLARARKLLIIAQEHPDLEVASTDSHVAGHHPDPGADVGDLPTSNGPDGGTPEYADGHDPATYDEVDVAAQRGPDATDPADGNSDPADES